MPSALLDALLKKYPKYETKLSEYTPVLEAHHFTAAMFNRFSISFASLQALIDNLLSDKILLKGYATTVAMTFTHDELLYMASPAGAPKTFKALIVHSKTLRDTFTSEQVAKIVGANGGASGRIAVLVEHLETMLKTFKLSAADLVYHFSHTKKAAKDYLEDIEKEGKKPHSVFERGKCREFKIPLNEENKNIELYENWEQTLEQYGFRSDRIALLFQPSNLTTSIKALIDNLLSDESLLQGSVTTAPMTFTHDELLYMASPKGAPKAFKALIVHGKTLRDTFTSEQVAKIVGANTGASGRIAVLVEHLETMLKTFKLSAADLVYHFSHCSKSQNMYLKDIENERKKPHSAFERGMSREYETPLNQENKNVELYENWEQTLVQYGFKPDRISLLFSPLSLKVAVKALIDNLQSNKSLLRGSVTTAPMTFTHDELLLIASRRGVADVFEALITHGETLRHTFTSEQIARIVAGRSSAAGMIILLAEYLDHLLNTLKLSAADIEYLFSSIKSAGQLRKEIEKTLDTPEHDFERGKRREYKAPLNQESKCTELYENWEQTLVQYGFRADRIELLYRPQTLNETMKALIDNLRNDNRLLKGSVTTASITFTYDELLHMASRDGGENIFKMLLTHGITLRNTFTSEQVARIVGANTGAATRIAILAEYLDTMLYTLKLSAADIEYHFTSIKSADQLRKDITNELETPGSIFIRGKRRRHRTSLNQDEMAVTSVATNTQQTPSITSSTDELPPSPSPTPTSPENLSLFLVRETNKDSGDFPMNMFVDSNGALLPDIDSDDVFGPEPELASTLGTEDQMHKRRRLNSTFTNEDTAHPLFGNTHTLFFHQSGGQINLIQNMENTQEVDLATQPPSPKLHFYD